MVPAQRPRPSDRLQRFRRFRHDPGAGVLGIQYQRAIHSQINFTDLLASESTLQRRLRHRPIN